MKNKLREILKIIRQLVVLLVLGVCIFFLWRIVDRHAVSESILWKSIRYLSYASIVVFVLTAIYTAIRIFHNYGLRRFEPGNPESLQQLAKIKRYHLQDPLTKQALAHPIAKSLIREALLVQGYEEIKIYRELTVYERKRKSILSWRGQPMDRVFLATRKDTNVIAIDNLLMNISNLTAADHKTKRYCSNYVLLATQMSDISEAYSIGAGIVNYLSDATSNYLLPLMISTNYGLVFYPEDVSDLPMKQSMAFRSFRNNLLTDLKRLAEAARRNLAAETQVRRDNGNE